MTRPRSTLISLSDTPYYHCVSRCVRRAFLCGVDHYSGQSYEHRRDWLEQKLTDTASIFAIKLCAYAVMNNHYHVVLHVRPDIAAEWSDLEVVERWHQLFKGSLFSQRFVRGEKLISAQRSILKRDIAKWRDRLCSISWFMRIVNEAIARRANAEDNCTGAFWESRFKSQALLDDRALLSCMAYVDLNPIRAKVAKKPETSKHTAVYNRIAHLKQNKSTHGSLEDFVGIKEGRMGIPFKLDEYLDLVDWTGRIMRADKRGAINAELPPILERLGLEPQGWRLLTTQFEVQFHNWVGSEHIVRQVCQHQGYTRITDAGSSRALFPT